MRGAFPIILFLVLTGCTAKSTLPIETILQDAKLTAHLLEPADVDVPFAQSESPVLLVYANNYIVKIVQSKASTGNKLLEIYRFGDNCPLYSAIDYGGLEGQFLSAIPYIQGDSLILHDIIKNLVAFVDLKSALQDSTYQPTVKEMNILTNFMIPYKNGVLYLSPYWTSDNRVRYNDKGEKFLLSGPDLTPAWEDGKYLTTNITAGCIVSNEEKDRILFFDAIDDLAEVYDYSLNLLKIITGPDDIRPEFMFPNDEHPIAIQVGEHCDTYLFGVCGSDEDVFAAYQGKGSDGDTGTYIFHFDWDGNLHDTYYVEGMVYGYLSASMDGRILYASVLDSCGRQRFCQYSITN